MEKNNPKWKFNLIYDKLSYQKKMFLWKKVN